LSDIYGNTKLIPGSTGPFRSRYYEPREYNPQLLVILFKDQFAMIWYVML